MELSNDEKIEKLRLKELKIARSSLLEFTTHTFPQYEVNWHHRLICDTLDRFVHTNEIPRLMIFAPPRMGKSELVSRRLPAFIFGQNPNDKIIACSYSADLSSMMNRDVQRIIDTEEYRQIFSQVRLNEGNVRTTGNYLRNSDIFEIVGKMGAYRSAGVGGGITGMGCNYLIIDDPIKNQEEADSSTYRQKVWDWYTTTAYTRLEKNGKVCVMLTRWNEDDLAGRLLQNAKKDPEADQWHVLSLPALAEMPKHPSDPREAGDPLWPDKYSMARMKAIRGTIGLRAWNALFQQRPTSESGGILRRAAWNYYDSMPAKFDSIIQSWDMTFKGKETSDYVAGQVWGTVGANCYLLDYFMEQLTFSKSLQAVRNMTQKWPGARAKLVEDKANGTAVVDVLKDEISGLILVEPKGGKVARVHAMSPLHEAGNLWIPKPEKAPWVLEFVESCANFPNAAHDDDVDAMSQAILYLGGDPRKKLMDMLRY
jgi:predicted phage terminase large subunit-like protein